MGKRTIYQKIETGSGELYLVIHQERDTVRVCAEHPTMGRRQLHLAPDVAERIGLMLVSAAHGARDEQARQFAAIFDATKPEDQ